MEPLYRGHIGTLETVLYIEVIFNSVIFALKYCASCYPKVEY